MDLYSWLVDDVGVSTLFVFVSVFLMFYVGTRKPVGIPPGPAIMVPGLGNIPNMIGKDPLKYFQDLRQTYGDVFSLYIGSQLTIVLNGHQTIRDAVVRRSHVFSDRPKHDFISSLRKGRPQGVIYSSGEPWKRERHFATQALKQTGFAKQVMQEQMNAEITSLLKLIDSKEGRPFELKKYIVYSVANIISVFLTNKRFEYGDQKLETYLENLEYSLKKLGLASIMVNAFPILKHFPGDPFGLAVMGQMGQMFHFTYDFMNDSYVTNVKTYDENHKRNLMDFIYVRDRTNAISETSVEVVKDFFAAGTDTTSNTLLWLFLYLTANPDVQDRFRREIHDNIGEDRLPTLNDKQQLPYVEATIYEVMRMFPVAPFSVPHAVAEDTVFRNYNIPETATVLVNLRSVLYDGHTFKDPEVFRPERFLDASGQVKVPPEFIPFGTGPRICMGEAAARMEVFLIAVSVFQKFQLQPGDTSAPDMDGVLGVTYAPKPFMVRALRNA